MMMTVIVMIIIVVVVVVVIIIIVLLLLLLLLGCYLYSMGYSTTTGSNNKPQPPTLNRGASAADVAVF